MNYFSSMLLFGFLSINTVTFVMELPNPPTMPNTTTYDTSNNLMHYYYTDNVISGLFGCLQITHNICTLFPEEKLATIAFEATSLATKSSKIYHAFKNSGKKEKVD